MLSDSCESLPSSLHNPVARHPVLSQISPVGTGPTDSVFECYTRMIRNFFCWKGLFFCGKIFSITTITDVRVNIHIHRFNSFWLKLVAQHSFASQMSLYVCLYALLFERFYLPQVRDMENRVFPGPKLSNLGICDGSVANRSHPLEAPGVPPQPKLPGENFTM